MVLISKKVELNKAHLNYPDRKMIYQYLGNQQIKQTKPTILLYLAFFVRKKSLKTKNNDMLQIYFVFLCKTKTRHAK